MDGQIESDGVPGQLHAIETLLISKEKRIPGILSGLLFLSALLKLLRSRSPPPRHAILALPPP